MESRVILYGASGHGKVIIDIMKSIKKNIHCVLDDAPKTEKIAGISVTAFNQFELQQNDEVILSIGNNHTRKKIASKLNCKFTKAIHNTSIISEEVKIHEGTVIMAGAIVNSSASIGKHCIINTASVIEHDCVIEDFAHISPCAALAGGVSVGEGTHVGINATVIQGVKIGKWATIGAGAVVIRNIPDYAVVVGNPGEIIKYNKEHE